MHSWELMDPENQLGRAYAAVDWFKPARQVDVFQRFGPCELLWLEDRQAWYIWLQAHHKATQC